MGEWATLCSLILPLPHSPAPPFSHSPMHPTEVLMELRSLLFETGGEHNTDATLQIAWERARALGIRQVKRSIEIGRAHV